MRNEETFLFKWFFFNNRSFSVSFLGKCPEDSEKNSNFVRFHSPHPLPSLQERQRRVAFLFTYRAAGGEIENTFRSFFIFKRKVSPLHKPSWIVRYCSTPPSFSSLLLVCTVVAIKRGPEPLKWLLSSRSRLLSSYPSLLLHPRCSFRPWFL